MPLCSTCQALERQAFLIRRLATLRHHWHRFGGDGKDCSGNDCSILSFDPNGARDMSRMLHPVRVDDLHFLEAFVEERQGRVQQLLLKKMQRRGHDHPSYNDAGVETLAQIIQADESGKLMHPYFKGA